MTTVVRYDSGTIPQTTLTAEGFLRVDAPITKMGVLHYTNPDGSSRGELRHPDDWGTPEARAALSSLPVLNGHPTTSRSDGKPLIDSRNLKGQAVGWTADVRADGEELRTPMTITDAETVAAIQRGKRGTSTGVEVQVVPDVGVYNGVAHQFRQKTPRGNHIAIVNVARAGTHIRLDGNQAEDGEAEGERHMVKITLDGISYDAAPEVANALTKAQGQISQLTTRLDEAAASGKSALDKLQAERDTLKEKLDAADKRDIRAEVRARVALEQAAVGILPKEQHAKLDAMDDAAIRRAVVAVTWPELKLDDKSADYIATRFEIALEDKGRKQDDDVRHREALGDQRRQIVPRSDAGGMNELEEAAAAANKRINSQWIGHKAA